MRQKHKVMGIVMMVVSSFGFSGEQTPVPLVYRQLPSPVTLSGTVVAAEKLSERLQYCCKLSVSVTNVSAQAILLLITAVHVEPMEIQRGTDNDGEGTKKLTGDRQETHSIDYFFGSNLLEPRSVESWESLLPPFGELNDRSEIHLASPNAEARVVFVQFSDGSIWGETAAGNALLRERNVAFERLKLLSETYRTKGEQEFLEELMKPSKLTLILVLQNAYRDHKNLLGVLNLVNERRENAERHQRSLVAARMGGP